MIIGDVFSRAWELWRRDVGWLILAGLVVGVVVGVVALLVFAVVAGMLAVSIGGIVLGTSQSSSGITGVSVGTLVVAIILGLVGYLVISVLAFVFYGGLFEMVIGAARENRGVAFGDLFGGFRRFGSYLVFWLVMVGITLVVFLVALVPIIGVIVGAVFMAWLGVTWLYVLPLIADQGLSFGEAARRSSQMVKSVGWWKTFGTIVVLAVAFFVVVLVISLIGRASSALSTVLLIAFEIAAGPFAICYVSTMYLVAGGGTAVAGVTPVVPGAPPAPPPPAPGAAPYSTPVTGGQPYQATPVAPPPPGTSVPAATAAAGAPPVAPATADVWKVAADPLAGAAVPPPEPQAHPPETAATEADPGTGDVDAAGAPEEGAATGEAAGAPSAKPAAPEPPAPPEPPAR